MTEIKKDEQYGVSSDGRSLKLTGNDQISLPEVKGTDFLEKRKGLIIQFQHIPSGERVDFKAFLTDYRDTHTAEWEKNKVYGRMDAMSIYKGTERAVTISWNVPAESEEEAKLNLYKIGVLKRMVYPVYEDGQISAPPLMKAKFINFLTNNEGDTGEEKNTTLIPSGVVCYIDGAIDYAPVVDDGFFFGTLDSEAFPKTISVSVMLYILHTHLPGWTKKSSKDGALVFSDDKVGNRYPFGYIVLPEERTDNEKFSTDSSVGDSVKESQEDVVLGKK